MVGYRGKRKQATRPQADKYQDTGYVQTRVALAEALARIEQLEQEIARPRLGCKRCSFTALVDWVNPTTGEITVALCPDCSPLIDKFIEQYTGWEGR